MANKPTTITYDGKVIASFSAGQTATLTTKGDKVEHNIVVKAGSGGAAPILQEKTTDKNGDVLPDDGYDGLSKVVVNVPSGGGITLTDVKPTIKMATKITPNVAAVNVGVTLTAISNMSVTKGE